MDPRAHLIHRETPSSGTAVARTASLSCALADPRLFTVVTQLLRAGILALYLLGATRMLGSAEYGTLAAAVSLAVVASTIVGMGSGVELLRSTAQNAHSFPEKWGQALPKYLVSGLLLAAVYLVGTPIALGVRLEFTVLLAIGITELILNPLSQCCAYAWLARDRIRTAAVVQLLPAFGRLFAIGAMLEQDSSSLADLTSLTALGALGSTSIALFWTYSTSPRPRAPRVAAMFQPCYSWAYAASSVSATLNTEIDKSVTLRLGAATDAGLYSAASRIVSALALPYSAVIQSRSRLLFSFGKNYCADHIGFLWRHGATFLGYGLLCILIIALVGDQAAALMGEEFRSATSTLYLAAWWIPVNGMRQLLGAVLTTTHLVQWRISADVLAGAAFVSVALLTIPLWGPTGAAIALLASEGMAVALMLLALLMRLRPKTAST